MFNNYFSDYAGFTLVSKGKLSPKFTMPNIKFHETGNPNRHVWNFISAMTLNGIDRDIFHNIVSWTFDKDFMRWYNSMDL